MHGCRLVPCLNGRSVGGRLVPGGFRSGARPLRFCG